MTASRASSPAPAPIAPSGAEGWTSFAARVPGLRPPLSPDPETVRHIADALAADADHVLLLGMTVPFFPLGRRVTAIDWCAETIARLWPGDRDGRVAQLGDWRELAAPERRYSAVIGDGCFTALGFPEDAARVAERLTVAAPGALLLVRCFLRPERCETLDDLAEIARTSALGGFHAFKWRLAMALAARAGRAEIAVNDILAAFNALFPDRVALAAASGWSAATIAEIDAYRGSALRLSFPTADELLGALGHPAGASWLPSGRYELAERCPILRWRIPG